MTASFPRRRLSLQLKLVVGLAVFVTAPLLVSVYLVSQVSEVAANFAASDAALREAPMEKALAVYRELFATTKQLQVQTLERIAVEPALAARDGTVPLQRWLEREPGMVKLSLLDVAQHEVAVAERPNPPGGWRRRSERHALDDGYSLVAEFAVSASLQEDYQALKTALDLARNAQTIRSALPSGFQWAFAGLLGGAVVVAIIIGTLAARRISRRVGVLISTTREVSAGNLDARAELAGRDEMAELAVAVNTMLGDLETKRRQIEYLQRIGAWQEVARRLAHEIKNPLTPIQLAVQQCASAYKGDDAAFARLLADTQEIVAEEIAGLRRLVDTFRTLGQLPKVEAAALPLAEVVDDLKRDPELAPHLELGGGEALTVRADRLLLRRLLSNLVENGIQAGKPRGTPTVTLAWQRDGDRARIFVDDGGPGVPDEQRERIFEPYVTTKETGTGLGLAIAKKIALEHGGDLVVAGDRAASGGARFVVTLPLA